MKLFLGSLFIILIFTTCDTVKSYDPPRDYSDSMPDLQTLFTDVENNANIELEDGVYRISRELILEGKKNVTIKGKGVSQTVLSFKDQSEGSYGIVIRNCKDIILEDFSIEDALSGNIKVTNTNGITCRDINTTWTGRINKDNGAIGLCLLSCRNILIEGCLVLGASDAGIYAGESFDAVIRNNQIQWNVAGVESGNSVNVKIHDNRIFENTGGIVVSDLPENTMTGENIEVFSNEIDKNNLWNFGPEGDIVSIIPPGTGLLILASRKVDVHDNQITNNRTIGIGIISYKLVDIILDKSKKTSSGGSAAQSRTGHNNKDFKFDPFPGEIHIHDNHYSSRYLFPDLRSPFGKIFLWKFGFKTPYIAWDGIKPEGYILADGRKNPAYRICVQEDTNIKRTILDFANDFKGLTTDPEAMACN